MRMARSSCMGRAEPSSPRTTTGGLAEFVLGCWTARAGVGRADQNPQALRLNAVHSHSSNFMPKPRPSERIGGLPAELRLLLLSSDEPLDF